MLTTTPYSDLALGRKVTSWSPVNGYGRNCVPNKDRADFPQVLESRHTIEEQAAAQIELLSTAETKLTAAIVAALLLGHG